MVVDDDDDDADEAAAAARWNIQCNRIRVLSKVYVCRRPSQFQRKTSEPNEMRSSGTCTQAKPVIGRAVGTLQMRHRDYWLSLRRKATILATCRDTSERGRTEYDEVRVRCSR